MNVNGPALLLENVYPSGNSWLTLKMVGTKSNRDGVGARVTVVCGKVTQIAEVAAGAGYLSSNDPRLHFGLGKRTVVDRITVSWPSGIVQKLDNVKANQILTITEAGK
jgi:hypothetical protein